MIVLAVGGAAISNILARTLNTLRLLILARKAEPL